LIAILSAFFLRPTHAGGKMFQSINSMKSKVDLDRYRWKNRLLLIFSQDQNKINQQIRKLDEKKNQDRDLLIFIFNQIDSKLREELEVTSDDFSALLIGKDGGIKSRSREIKDGTFYYNLIDRMPMRRREMRKN
jgi:hypothetical protein